MSLLNKVDDVEEETRIEIRRSMVKEIGSAGESRNEFDPQNIFKDIEKIKFKKKKKKDRETNRVDFSSLIKAIRLGKSEVVDFLIERPSLTKALFFFYSNDNDTLLHIAARAGQIHVIKTLLAAYANFQNPNLVKELLTNPYRNDYNINKEVEDIDPISSGLIKFVLGKNNEGNSMLHEAMMCNKKDVAEMVFKAIEPDNYGGSSSTTEKPVLLEYCCYADALFIPNKAGKTVLYLAMEARYKAVAKRILDKCTAPDCVPPGGLGLSPVVLAIMNRDIDMLSFMLEKRPNWIYLTAHGGYHECVALLLDKSNNSCASHRDKYGYLPIHLASHGGHLKAVEEFLIRIKSSRDLLLDPTEMLDNSQRNILHIAANSGKLEVVKYILQTDQSFSHMINEKDCNGNTPLHLATLSCHSRTVYYLTWDPRVDLNSL